MEVARRFRSVRETLPKLMNVVRAVSSEGFGRLRYYREIRRRLDWDKPLRAYFEGETTVLPEFFLQRMKQDLGPLWHSLPANAIYHDPNAYLKAETEQTLTPLKVTASMA